MTATGSATATGYCMPDQPPGGFQWLPQSLYYLCLSPSLFFLFFAEADPAFSGGISMKMLASIGNTIKLSLGLNWIKPGSHPDALSLNRQGGMTDGLPVGSGYQNPPGGTKLFVIQPRGTINTLFLSGGGHTRPSTLNISRVVVLTLDGSVGLVSSGDAEDIDAELPAEETSDEEAAPKGRGMRTRRPNTKYAGEFWRHTNNKDQDIPVPGIELPLSTK
ncbi:hypothetical protein B0H13DRAFT_2278810 [Mycena leptocephala]|nr:hypothetical protein B0H13DRAFT_2278810 [Mycena leptocephala]